MGESMNYAHTVEAYRDALEMEKYSIIAREERRDIQREKRLEDSILDAYERIERTTCCDIGEL